MLGSGARATERRLPGRPSAGGRRSAREPGHPPRPGPAARRHEGRRVLQGTSDPLDADAPRSVGGVGRRVFARVAVVLGCCARRPGGAPRRLGTRRRSKLLFTTALNGLTLAALYFLVASGFTLVFGLMRNVNLAHGSLYLFGAYIGYVVGDRSRLRGFWRRRRGSRALPSSGWCCRWLCSGSCTARTCARPW